MSILTASSEHRRRLAAAEARERAIVVAVLCAAWCTTCKEFRNALSGVAEARPDVTFVWLDVEDDAELCGDLDVESFPTLVAYRGAEVLHYGVTLPVPGTVTRLVDELAVRERGLADVPDAVRVLAASLATERA